MVAVVAQDSDVVRAYIEDNGLPFNILIDETRAVSKQYGVWHRIGLVSWNLARPALFLVDHSGLIRYSFVADSQDEFPAPEDIQREIDRIVGTAARANHGGGSSPVEQGGG